MVLTLRMYYISYQYYLRLQNKYYNLYSTFYIIFDLNQRHLRDY